MNFQLTRQYKGDLKPKKLEDMQTSAIQLSINITKITYVTFRTAENSNR